MAKIGGPIFIRDLTEKSLIKLVLLDIPGDLGPICPGGILDPLGTIWIPRTYGSNFHYEDHKGGLSTKKSGITGLKCAN